MFRIESYITPIILEHVAKYVKNIKPEDMQFSLWEGEMALQNLDLRLDVLEEELNLPVEITSGHIHELNIRIPWTKITSEPIRITINTIEFVLKRRNDGAKGNSSTNSSPQRKALEAKKRKRPNKPDDQQLNQSAVSSIANKIINNISVECQNIIFKYVEEDIVLSMNIQLLQFNSADENWKAAMIDVHPLKVLIRKIINVSDLTICVDKLNSAGHIEVCQEPIVYRCSFEIRVLRRHNIKSMDTTSVTRAALFTKSIDMNISSMQFPMIMRLLKMVTSLGNNNLSSRRDEQKDDDDEDQEKDDEGVSFFVWAWNMLPSFNLETPVADDECAEESVGHLKDFGVYIEELNFTLKNAELVVDSIISNAKRIKYIPIVRLTLGGMYCERVGVAEQNWYNIKAGITQLIIEPLGPYKNDSFSDTSLVKSPSEEIRNGYLDKSLFDERTCNTEKCLACANFEEYMMRYTDEYMLSRTTIFAFDSIEYETPRLMRPSMIHKNASINVPGKDTHRSYRFLSSGIIFRWSQTFQQVKNEIIDLINSCDYSAYYADRIDSLASPSTKFSTHMLEDHDDILERLPICVYKFDLKDIQLEVHAQNEPPSTQKSQRLPNSVKHTMPYFVMHFSHLDGTLTLPLNLDRLASLVIRVVDKPHAFIDYCYKNYSVNIKQFSIAIVNPVQNTSVRLIHVPHIGLIYNDLILKEEFFEEDLLIPDQKMKLDIKNIELNLTRQDLVMSRLLLNCFLSYRPHLLWNLANETSQSARNNIKATFNTGFNELIVELLYYNSYTILYGSLHSLQASIICCDNCKCVKKHLIFETKKDNQTKHWLNVGAQRNPNGIESLTKHKKDLLAISLTTEPFAFYMDMVLFDFIREQLDIDNAMEKENSSEVELHTQPLQAVQTIVNSASAAKVHINPLPSCATNTFPAPLQRRSSRNSMPYRKISHPEETIHCSSERDEKVDLDKIIVTAQPSEQQSNSWWQYIQHLAISVEIAQGTILIAEKFLFNKSSEMRSLCTEIMLPKISLKSANTENVSTFNLREKFSITATPNETVSWIIGVYCLAIRKVHRTDIEYILSDVYTTITIAITHKTEDVAKVTPDILIEEGQIFSETVNKVQSELQSDREQSAETPQGSSREVDSVNVHVDITPIQINISEAKCKQLLLHLRILQNVVKLFQSPTQIHDLSPTPPIQIVTVAEENATIKQFLDLETSSISSVRSEEKAQQNILSLFCQWTVPKISITLESASKVSNSKIVLEVEDLLAMIDKREDFTKYTSKVGQCSLNYYEPNPITGWIVQPYLRIKVFSEVANLPFLNIVYTCVGLKSFYSRIGVKRKSDTNRCISEVLITLQPFEVILDLERLQDFVGSVSVICFQKESKQFPQNSKVQEAIAGPVTALDLPLIHLDSKGLAVYTPLSTRKDCCTVLIWKIESIKVSPNLENPLQRNPIRGDVYSKAAQMGLLNTPGSLIEDRQYELVLQNISIDSGHWEQILNHMLEEAKTFYHTNPALEWNSQSPKPSLHIADILSNFNFVGIFAPCIVYNNILICGQAVEFNCASDFMATIDTDQLYTFGVMVDRVSKILDNIKMCSASTKISAASSHEKSSSENSLSIYHSLNCLKSCSTLSGLDQRRSILFKERQSSSLFDSIDEGTEQIMKTDSGFQSSQARTQSTHRENPIERNDGLYRHMPQTVSLLAGTFSIQFLKVESKTNIDKTCQGCSSRRNQKKSPLLLILVSQPNFMFTQNIYDSTIQMSLFNFNIRVPNSPVSDDPTQLFPIEILTTHPGELNASGIPPPLATLRKHLTKQKLVEIDIETSKPIVILIHEAHANIFLRNALFLLETITRSGCLEMRTTKRIQRSTKIKLIRGHFFDADRFHAKLDELIVVVKNDSDYICKFACNDVQLNGSFLMHPEKAVLKSAVGSIYFKVGEHVFLHPMAFRSSVVLISETWHTLPLVSSTLKFDVVHFDVDVRGLQQLQQAMDGVQRLLTLLDAEYKRFLRERSPMGEPVKMDVKDLMVLKYPTAQNYSQAEDKKRRKKCVPREEFYQDDLRAGAFQFVEMTTDAFLPLPYQIQIIKKNFGIICWRYPQPRKMCCIEIYPVPMASFQVQTPINIKCRIEYFSESHECFLQFSDFMLSETKSQIVMLPERDICANIWRVVILQSLITVNGECFDPSESEGEKIQFQTIEELFTYENKDSDFILHPRVLVGCMRIDSSFQSESVPKVQVLVSCTSLQVSLLNQTNENRQMPPALGNYRLAQTKQINQEFLVVQLERLSVHTAFNSSKIYCFDCTLTLGIKCLDYGFLNMLPILEETTLQSFVYVNKPRHILNVNVGIDKLRINLGPSIVHSLLSSKRQWTEDFNVKEHNKGYVVLPKCTVINLMRLQIAFGQSGTTERIQLLPMECSLYCFGTDCQSQELTFFIADDETQITDASQSIAIPLRLDQERKLQPIRIGEKCLTIEFRKLSSTQIIVLLKGQIELVSMVPQELRVEFHDDCHKQNSTKPYQYLIEAEGRVSFYWALQSTSNITMTLRFDDSKGKGRSGDIPLKCNKKLPWLVKVPTVDSDFVSLWVRVLREDITELCNETFRPQKILVTIWPIFELRSMLTRPLKTKEEMTDQIFMMPIRGGRHVLSLPTTHQTEHILDMLPVNDVRTCPCTVRKRITLKAMQWNNFFWYDEQMWGVDNAAYKLEESNAQKWPFDDEDELRINRPSLNPIPPAFIFRECQSREFACTMCLEISPWGLFINASGVDVSIYGEQFDRRIRVGTNCVEMVMEFESSFTVDLQLETDWVSSLPIYCDGQTLPSGARYYVLSENSSIDIDIVRKSEVFKFVLDFKIENGRHVFRLRPKYIIANFTKCKLHVLPFAMDHKEKANRQCLEELDSQSDKVEVDCVESVTNCIGRTLDFFHDFKPSVKSKRSKDTAFVCFVCLKVSENSDISIPIPLAMPFTRRCFSVQNKEASSPLAVTLIEKDRVYYLNVFEDQNPAFLVSNQTDVNFLIAQTSASENSKVSKTTPEYSGRHFEWFQQLPAFSNTYYTPPELYANFPDVEYSMCNITLSLQQEHVARKKIKWSKPIRTDKTWEKFLYIPSHGDIKVIICDQHRVKRIFIYYIAQHEFSVKDLRSRLPSAQFCPEAVNPAPTSTDSSLVSLTPSTALVDLVTLKKAAPKCMHFSNVQEAKTQLKVRLYMKEAILSLHTDAKKSDFIKTEIIGLYVDDLLAAYDDVETKRELNVIIPNLQLDNQLYSTGKYDFPVVLCAQEIYDRFEKAPSVHYLDHTFQSVTSKANMMHCTLGFFEDELKLRSIDLKLSPIRIYIEDAYLNDLLDAVVDCTPRNCVYTVDQMEERISLSNGQFLLPHIVAAQAICIAEPLQLRNFQIDSLNMLLSVHTSMRLYIALDHSPLSFSQYSREQILTVPLRFGQSLSMHYLSGAIFGAGWVVGSLEILGSPSGLARSFTTGLRDFVSMPMQGLFRGPWAFIVGMTQGSASLLRNVTAGTVNSVSKLAASVARNLDRLTLDQEHIERTEALRRSRPHGFTEGFAQGITGLGISMLGAVGGLARHTLEARTPVEVMTGMGKGIVGALTKPLSGAAEVVALAGQGLLNTVGFNTMPELRMPCVCENLRREPSAFRVWKQLPGVVDTDQILFNHEVTLVINNQLRRGHALLTSSVFTIMEVRCNNLLFVIPVDKVEMTCDSDDKTLYYIHLLKDRGGAEEDNYTNQRIMTYLHSSTSLRNMSSTAGSSLSDLLQCQEQEWQSHRRKKLDWAFHINEALGKHIVKYLKIMNRNY